MISYKDIANVLNAVIPLYVTMFLAYASVKWWKLFTPDQCSGINRFVAVFAIPLLSFEFISRINPFKLNYLFVAADAVSKVLVLLLLLFWSTFSENGSLDWCITAFSLTTLPNTLVMGIPLLKAMYGDNQEALMIQVVVLQSVIWYTLLLFLFELRAARNDLVLLVKVSDQMTRCSSTSRSSTKAEKNSDQDQQSIAQESDDQEDEVVHVIVAKPMSSSSPDLEQQRDRVVLHQNSNKVAPDSSEDEEYGKELHMFVWRCACCSNSEGLCEHSVQVCSRKDEESGDGGEKELDECEKREEQVLEKGSQVCSCMSTKMVRLIMTMVWSKLIRNPNTYASLFGLIWALVSSKWNIKKPAVMENSVTILSNAGLGMAMFSLGLFMALQPRIIACGSKLAAYGMLMRFIAGPAFMAIASIVVGVRGKTLKVSIVQAALPQGIVPFVFAREYNLHSEVLSTGVIFGMIISLPITILYYVLLGL
ncbi:auxin efflux carrier component 7-like isoform X2 [Dioscorea cayenensis subsp. rotundata]|uniref:Auxin efflux carrier component n=1 Tax=Dioscorea cayennensis subsp. rotundata TaxID=55577 RepID=A0AB40B770_DIOCR|nr:auxin efflux carrier component 7-like isoform X2 [Dioscorea cayenensis subsp. rotundata]